MAPFRLSVVDTLNVPTFHHLLRWRRNAEKCSPCRGVQNRCLGGYLLIFKKCFVLPFFMSGGELAGSLGLHMHFFYYVLSFLILWLSLFVIPTCIYRAIFHMFRNIFDRKGKHARNHVLCCYPMKWSEKQMRYFACSSINQWDETTLK